MYRDPAYLRLWEREDKFIKDFLPQGARDGHHLLFDFNSEIKYHPDEARLSEGFDAYYGLIEDAAASGPEMVGAMIRASNLMLGMLTRAVEARLKLKKSPRIRALISLIRLILAATESEDDGFKRLTSMERLLEKRTR